MITHREAASPQAVPAQRVRMPLWQTWLALVGILLIAAQFRTIGLYSWDGTSNLHPDERFLVYTVYVLQVPHSVGDYFRSGCAVNGEVPSPSRKVDLAGRQLPPDQYEPSLESGCNTLNPRNYGWAHFFAYGILPTSLTRLAAELRNNWEHPGSTEMISPTAIRDAGRSLSVVFDLGSVLLLFLIGRRLYGERAGLLAAALYALAVLPIQLAHFLTVDATTGFFLLLALYWSVRAAQRGGIGTFTMLGLSIGAAMACRITMATLGLLAMIAVAQRVWGHKLERPGAAQPAANRLTFVRGASLLILAGLTTFISARILGPDLFIGSSFFDIRPEPRFIESITSVSGYVSGKIDAPFSQQWANRVPFLFPLSNMIIWGLGTPLGLVAWVAWAAALWQIIRRRIFTHLLPVIWIGFYFAWQGGQFGMTMRYYVSLYGLLALLAAWGLLALWERGRRSSRLAQVWAALPTILVVIGTFLWAVAFSAIYTRPHSRIEASRWIYANIPAGSTVTSEVWDDALPLGVDGQNPNQYTILQTAPYQEDDLIKYTGYVAADGTQVPGLFEQLDQADYIILSSNRVYDSATRLPMRYPALTRYYHSLFNGELGFEQVADIHSYPTLFGLQFPDYGAEEAFSVYDHPRVLIFKKTAAYTRVNAERLITDSIAWGEIYKLPTVKIRQVPTALRLTDAQWPAYRAAGTWAQLFNPASLPSQLPWLFWLLIIEALGLAALALLFRPLARLPDRGFALAKTLGLLLVGYAAWLLGSFHLAAFTPTTVWLCAFPFLLVGGLAAWLQRHELAAFARQRRAALLTAEGLFLLAFFGFVIIRALNPDLWHPARGGEKPMDLAFLTAVLKSAAFPPYDPWFAGGYINYYYFGFVLIGTLTHLTGIVPEVAYNLAIPTLFGMTALGAWGVAYNLVAPTAVSRQPSTVSHVDPSEDGPTQSAKRTLFAALGKSRKTVERRAIWSGVLAAFLVAVAGNLAQAYWLLPGSANPAQPMLATTPRMLLSYAAQQSVLNRPEWAFWDAPRTVGYALGEQLINEFPFFTFLYGDLHAHMIALPIGLVVLGLLVSLVRSMRISSAGVRPGFWQLWADLRPDLIVLVFLALTTGALRATNTWDYPGALGISLLTLGLISWLRIRRSGSWRMELIGLGLRAGLLIVLGTLLFQPFLKSFATDYAGFSIWFGARTPTTELLKINGVWIFALISGGALLYHRAGRMGRRPLLAIVLAASLLIVLTALMGMSALLAIGLLLCGALVLLFDLAMRQRFYDEYAPLEAGPLSLLLVLWGLCALGLIFVPEVLVAKGDIGRMNTVFKLGLQSWTLFALVAAVALVWSWQQIARAGVWTWVWRGAALLLGAALLAYPIMAVPARIADRFDRSIGLTLDGMAYMAAGSWAENNQRFSLAEDAAAITWMRSNIVGTPIILEGHNDQMIYGWAGRISTYTGLPTLLGWTWHITQQRSVASVEPIIESRQAVIEQIYTGSAPAETMQLLQNYGIEYVYVGLLERARYGQGLTALDQLARNGQIKTVYQQGQTRIYQVPTNGQPPGVLTTTLPTTPATGPSPGAADLPEGRVGNLPATDPYPQFGRGGGGEQLLALGAWIVAWFVIQLLGMPLAALIFGRLGSSIPDQPGQKQHRWTDGGYSWARTIGLIILGYAVWLPVSAGFWQYDRAGLAAGGGIIVGLNLLLIALIGRLNGTERNGIQVLLAHFRAQRKQILQSEAMALLAFLALLGLRAYNPDLWHPYWGGEKPFEFGLLNAVLRSPHMPPYSPFFSDGIVNYYYYGFFLVSLAVKATGIAPSVAFNLIVPTLFGLFVSGVFAVAARISGQARIGLAAVALVALLGNLAAAFQVGWSAGLGPVLQALAGGLNGFGQRLDAWFVGPSRVIPNTINEFPLWGFLFADLHPHLIALPLTMLMIGLAYQLFDPHRVARTAGQAGIEYLPRLAGYALAALTLGALAITNSWDVPTYSLLLGGALAARAWRSWQSGMRRLLAAVGGLITAGLIAGAGGLLYSPFFQNFKAPVGGVGLVTTPTVLRDYLLIYGLPLVLIVPTLLRAAWRLLAVHHSSRRSSVALGLVARPLGPEQMPRALVMLLAIVVAAAVAAAIAGPVLTTLGSVLNFEPPAWLITPPALLGTRVWLAALLLSALAVLFDRRIGPSAWFGFWLATLGLAVSFGFELVYIRDHLAGGDWYRMNTVFKFGLQAWVLLGLAAALALPHTARALRRAGLIAEALAWPIVLMLVLVALVFPFAGIASRTAYRFAESPVPTLDGLAFLDNASYMVFPGYLGLPEGSFAPTSIALRYDADAIRWLNASITGTPVVLQSSAEFYRLYGVRIAANTGLPTVVSPLHEAEQRASSAVYERDHDVQRFYRSADQSEILNLLAQYRIGYVYVGPIERLVYGDTGAETLAALARQQAAPPLTVAYSNEQVTIYKVQPIAYDLARLAQTPVVPQQPADDLSLRALEQQAAAEPNNLDLAWQLALRYAERGRYTDAVKAIEQQAQQRPDDAGVQQFYGDMLNRAGQLDAAEAAYRQAIVAQPTAANYTKLGSELIVWGRLDAAEEALAQAVSSEPNLAEPQFYLGQIAEERGQNERAALYYRHCLELLSPSDPLYTDAETALQRLGK